MDLFKQEIDPNLLPYDGEVIWYGQVMDQQMADSFFKCLLQQVEWKNDEAVIFGRHIITKRMAAWYGDAGFDYTYSNTTKRALPWTQDLLDLKKLAEKITGLSYNSCLLNLYHSGEEGMAWHSDDEKQLAKGQGIASFSLGAERKFAFKHKKTKEVVSLMLPHGSLLLMKGLTQDCWWHRLPKTTKVKSPRINLTFRTMLVA